MALSLAEILLVDNELVAFKSGLDCRFYLSGPIDEVRRADIQT
jgi:hypothetical protein